MGQSRESAPMRDPRPVTMNEMCERGKLKRHAVGRMRYGSMLASEGEH